MLIYCDSVIVIYSFEGQPPFRARALARLAAARAAGHILAVSDLSRLECRVKPMRVGNATALALYDGFFILPDVRMVPLSSPVYERATNIRATLNFKLADAIHLAAAVEARCDRFLTNDARLRAFTGIPVEVLP